MRADEWGEKPDYIDETDYEVGNGVSGLARPERVRPEP